MKRGAVKHAVTHKKAPKRETLIEAYEVRAYRDEEEPLIFDQDMFDILHADVGDFEAIKAAALGHGEQTILPDDCEFGDNDLCYVET